MGPQVCHNAWLVFFFIFSRVEVLLCCPGCSRTLSSSNPPALASWNAEITGMSHCAWLFRYLVISSRHCLIVFPLSLKCDSLSCRNNSRRGGLNWTENCRLSPHLLRILFLRITEEDSVSFWGSSHFGKHWICCQLKHLSLNCFKKKKRALFVSLKFSFLWYCS